MDDDKAVAAPEYKTLLQLAQTLSCAVAIVEPEQWSISFENANFFKWFPPGEDADEPLPERVPGFNADRARSRMEGARPYSFETEVKVGNRELPLSVEIRPLPDDDAGLIVVECIDRSKQKQAEYMLESYSAMAEKNARDLEREKDRVERLLLNIMPKSVYEEMRDYGTVTPQVFNNATVLMIDFVGHTDMEISRDPAALVTELNDIFTVFDRITDLFGGERIRTIGDAYVAVCGVPVPTPDHAHSAARIALRIQRYMERRNAAHAENWLCRVGLNTGPVIGSLVGIQKYVYDIFGPGISMAARMEALSEPMQITVSDSTYQLIKDDFLCTDRGDVEVKGFGTSAIYTLDREMPHMR